ncbi:HET-domain-containing protein [Karstenula rhodostoma CBS 690.94]|uniref:HET-domain-containing protein n=1 Tax=Karstenula rhodostoma CBS 690.94 TaxID=1392251 RepID=A0A9P4PBV4_9PLEO|nr:HET-domain-containing protein [Karstenula rhodostoma CBS 690.94]
MALHEELCATCRTLDIASLFITELEHEEAIALGPLETILNKSKDCGCCKVIVDSLLAQQPWQKVDVNMILAFLRAEGNGTDVWLYSYPFIEEDNTSPTLRVAVSTSHGKQTSRLPWREHVGDLQLMRTSAKQLELAVLGHGKEMQQTADVGIARNWLDDCLRDHGSLCSQPGSGPDSDSSFGRPSLLRVIDVSSRCLVNLPNGTQYVALSYCWPRKPGLTNTRASNIDFREKGSISMSKGLSETINDACNFVRGMSERYLWVDALCIVQDDGADKAHQISQMDLVYGSALLTIVVAPDSTEAEGVGLPGYRIRTKLRHQIIHKTHGVELSIPKPCLDDVVSYTRWETRGWTFQEAHLSRRLLFLTSQQLYYQCACGVRCEDTTGEGLTPTAFIKHSTNLWNPKSAYENDSDDNWGDMFLSRSAHTDASRLLGTHDLLLTDFCRRELSFPSDILNAIQGILKVFSDSMRTEFYAGLPLKWLDHALLWQLYGAGERRTGFPSFSWAGWESIVDPPVWLGTRDTRRLITWYRCVAGQLLSCETDAPMVEEHASFIVPPDNTIQNIKAQNAPSHDMMLVTTTQTASFSLSTMSIDYVHHSTGKDGEHMWILDANSHRAGIILLDRGWKSIHVTEKAKYEFIMLSMAGISRVGDLLNFDEAYYEDREWCLLNVMLVAWKSDGVAERVAVGYIHCDAWREAGPATMVVHLV